MNHIAHAISPVNPMQVFEDNYRLVGHLFAEMGRLQRFMMSGEDGLPNLDVKVLERARYTTTLNLTKCFDGNGRLLPDLEMTVRVYHDAELAEVVAYQGCHRIPPPYLVGSGQGFHTDERRQINHLLRDLLRYCAARNYRVVGESDCASS